MFITINGKSDTFSWDLGKNPQSLPLEKKTPKGDYRGWYSDNQTYHIYFKDTIDRDYIDPFKYASSITILEAINLYFSSLKEGNIKYDVSIHISSISIKNEKFFNAEKYIGEAFGVEYKNNWGGGFYSMTIKGKGIWETFMFFQLWIFIISFDWNTYYDENVYIKYAKYIKNLDLPYHIRYVFKRYIFKKSIWKKVKDILNNDSIKMVFGDSYMARRDSIWDEINIKNRFIADHGCGKGTFLIDILKKNNTFSNYIGYDISSEEVEKGNEKIKKYSDNEFLTSNYEKYIDTLKNKNNIHLICSEVIEHVDEYSLNIFFEQINQQIDWKKMYITTPNKRFNKNYFMKEGEIRHLDHKKEFVYEELEELMLKYYSKEMFLIKHIGDCVDGEGSTFLIIIEKNNV